MPVRWLMSSNGRVILWEASAGRQKSAFFIRLYNFANRLEFIGVIEFDDEGALDTLMT